MLKKPVPAENEDQVKLKPFLGMRPGVYLTILYSFIILLVFFLFLVLPGLRNPTAALIVKTTPDGAAIRVNDVYMGLAGSRIIIPKGTHTIEAVMPGFENAGAVHTIPSRVFASRFFPRVYKIEFELKSPDPAGAFAIYAGEFAEWTFMGEPTSSWQIPLVLSDGAYRLGSYRNDEMEEILRAAFRFGVTQAALRDLIRAKMLLDNGGNAPAPAALLGSITDILVFLSQTQDSAFWLSKLLPVEASDKIENSDWYIRNTINDLPIPNISIQRRTEIAGLNFYDIRSDINFMISENPVSQNLFEEFLNENPLWREHKTDYFPGEITLNPLEIYKRGSVTGITFFAAEAFCEWLTGRLPASMSNMEARLPTEDEWLIAAFAVDSMRAPGWEWCGDYYAPIPKIKASAKAINAVKSPERLLRGKASPSSSESRTSMPPELSSPIITFRPVIAEKE